MQFGLHASYAKPTKEDMLEQLIREAKDLDTPVRKCLYFEILVHMTF